MSSTQDDPNAVVLVLDASILSTATELWERIHRLLPAGAEIVVCDVEALHRPCPATIDALCRLQLAARRSGRSVHLRNASVELREALALLGLSDVLPPT